MKRILPLLFLIVVASSAFAQDIPLFTQKLTNSFLYNPAVAGNSLGSVTLSRRQYWSSVLDAPATNFFSIHTPFGRYRFGTGLNFYQDKVGPVENLYVSAAFAYHVKITDNNSFSMGLSAEYDNQRYNPGDFYAVDPDDELLRQSGSKSNVDISFGMNYNSKYVTIGAAANRLRALTGILDSTAAFPAYYAGTARFHFRTANDMGLFEPMITYRGFAHGSSQIDAGLFYTFNNLVIVGGAYRTGGSGTLSATAGVKLWKRVTVGYSRDFFMGDVSKGLGATNEFTLRFDFMDEEFFTKVKNARTINTRALALRRKSLSTYRRGSSYSQSSRYKKNIRRKSYMSPNYRMDSSKKLQSVRRKGKSSYKPNHRRRR